MCGLTAILAFQQGKVDPAIIQRMTEMLKHRGPDAQGSYLSGPVGLGFRRLSILDLSPSGQQPMLTLDGKIALVFNGEIYNYIELRRELEALGYRFKSSGDTEVLLYAYCEWGLECLAKLNGMWGFVIYDERQGKLVCSRDRFGIKPLYYYRNRDYMLFSSEIKAIRASGLYQSAPHWPVVANFLLRGILDNSQESFYAGIYQIPAGSVLEVSLDGTVKQKTYWSLDKLSDAISVADPARDFAELFEDAVRLHMRSDVPVGIHLSGGLDSTSILCAAARLKEHTRHDQPLAAFSYITPEYDESRYIEDTITQTHAQLIRLESKPAQFWDSLSKVLWFQDEPIHSMTPLVGFELMRLSAAQGIKVILNGQGADETLAGYPNYFRDYWYTLIKKGQFQKAWQEINIYAQGNHMNAWLLFNKQLKHWVWSEFNRNTLYRYLASWKHHKKTQANTWFTHQLSEWLPAEEPAPIHPDLNTVLIQSIERDPLPLYLRIEDRNSMAHSVEARLPFLDYRLVTWLFKTPAEWKMNGVWNKFILREAMRNRIPESVRTRVDKMGFPVPAKQWLSQSLYAPMLDILTSQKTRERGIYNTAKIIEDLTRQRRGDIDVSHKLFSVAQLEIWSAL